MRIFQTIIIWVLIAFLILYILCQVFQWILFYVNDTWWDKMMKNMSRKEPMPLTKGQMMAILGGGYIIIDIFAVSYAFYHHHQSMATIGKSKSFYFKVYLHKELF